MTTHTLDNSGNQLSGQLRTFYRRKFIRELNPRLVYNMFGVPDTIPEREGRTISWPSMDAIEDGETLAEGADGSEGTLTLGATTATLADIGKYYRFSKRVSLEAPDPILETFVTRLATKAARSLDSATRDVLSTTTNIFYPTGATSDGTVDAAEIIDLASIRSAMAFLDENDSEPVMDMLSPNGGTATVPGEAAYIGIAHSHVCSDIRDNASTLGFEPVSSYANGNVTLPGEIGKIGQLRILSAGSAGKFVADAGVSNVDVYHMHIFGADAFGVVDLADRPAEIHVVPHTQLDHGNPLGRRGSVGWSAEHAGALLLPNSICSIHCASARGAN